MTLDAGARQVVRMVRARPLDDDPVLLGRQKEMAALKVVGSGVDASQVGTGKTITTRPRDRAPRHHHAPVPRARGRRGPPARPVARRAHARRARRAACRRWRPTPTVRVLCRAPLDRRPGTRASTASSATAPASCSCANGVLDRYPGRPAGDRLAPADRRRGAALRQPRHRGPPGAQAGPASRASPTAGC